QRFVFLILIPNAQQTLCFRDCAGIYSRVFIKKQVFNVLDQGIDKVGYKIDDVFHVDTSFPSANEINY
ncbi:MAG: hypothetical protein II868_01655, partial [Butyrivibrio sp.]|nr:hypothetical protein [Butyrivibrio sp.]